MTNTNFTKTAEGIVQERNDRYAKVFQPLTLITLVFFWAGYFYSLYNGNSNNISSYPFLIIAFSILNAQVLFTKEKAVNRGLDILAKCEGILFCVWAFASEIKPKSIRTWEAGTCVKADHQPD